MGSVPHLWEHSAQHTFLSSTLALGTGRTSHPVTLLSLCFVCQDALQPVLPVAAARVESQQVTVLPAASGWECSLLTMSLDQPGLGFSVHSVSFICSAAKQQLMKSFFLF